MDRVHLADRAADGGSPNEIARIRAELAADGIEPVNLSDPNPTHHGLTHPGVLEAVARHVSDAASYEPDPRGLQSARAALAAHFGGHADDYYLTSSTSQAYSWLLALLADPGEAIATPRPGYPLTAPLARIAGVRTVDYRMDYVHPDGWLLDPDSLHAAAANPATRAFVAVSPGNPTGSYLSADAETVIEACTHADIALIADEVFAPFALDGAMSSLAGDDRVVTFTLGGLSKLLCAPQLKLAWIRVSGPRDELPAVRDGLDTIADTFLPVSAPVAHALGDLLDIADESIAATRARLAANLAELRRVAATSPWRVRRCDGGWTALLDVPRTAGPLVPRLLRTAHLYAHPGWFYDVADDGVLAISLLPRPGEFAHTIQLLRNATDEICYGL